MFDLLCHVIVMNVEHHVLPQLSYFSKNERTLKMKFKLFLFLACALLAGRATAQTCFASQRNFPQPMAGDKTAPPFCMANADSDSPSGQGGRLRWNNNSSHALQLFDTDDDGHLMWCANPDNTNGGSSGDTSNCLTTNNSILCLQQDGNMVIYGPSGTIMPQCVGDGGGGTPLWASGTENTFFTTTNNGNERLVVEEDVSFKNGLRSGDRAVIRNNPTNTGILWVTLGYSDVN
jgi:hypothetical protein